MLTTPNQHFGLSLLAKTAYRVQNHASGGQITEKYLGVFFIPIDLFILSMDNWPFFWFGKSKNLKFALKGVHQNGIAKPELI